MECTGHGAFERDFRAAGEKWQNGDRDLSSYVGLVQKLVRSGVAETYENEVTRAAQEHLSVDMDTSIVYDGMAHTISFGGETYSAYNNVQSKANGPAPMAFRILFINMRKQPSISVFLAVLPTLCFMYPDEVAWVFILDESMTWTRWERAAWNTAPMDAFVPPMKL